MNKKLLLGAFLLFSLKLAYGQSLNLSEMNKQDGFVPFYLDEEKGKIYLEIDKLDEEFLYVNSLTAGIGSNDIGLDRGQLGNTRIVEFRKTGNKVFLVHLNYDFRAYSDNPAEVQSIKDAFAESVLWGFEITQVEGEKIIVDATSFYLQDAHGVADRLSRGRQGSFRTDASRSALYLPMTKNFPENTEVEATITLTGQATGSYLRSVTPSPDAVTVRQRHSFIQLPDDEYQPREFDPRGGFGSISYMDFTTPIAEPIMKRFIARHRLVKKDPSAAVSEVVEPIIYYLDRGTPEPVASALIEGGNWWSQAFEAAGFKDAFRVELAPEGMDLMDIRYNVIQWVHRSTRGWSYGASVRDPRTGEILKGHVSLGSLRVRQDYLIAQGLLQPFEEGAPANPEMLKLAVARLKQLSAHEIGHTIGLAHSYATSADGRSSVMDYPYPLITETASGELDLSNAYDDKIGAWDKWAITYGYGVPAPGVSEEEFIEKTLTDTYAAGHQFITDSDSRATSGAHPQSHLWDNGSSAPEELERMLSLRANRMETFGLNAIPEGQPHALLEEIFVPLYLMHRYQIEATAKLIGGVDYRYKIKGDNQPNHGLVHLADQEAALETLLKTISTENLLVPDHILKLIPPRPFGYGSNRETFVSRVSPIFDPIAPAEAIVDLTFDFMLNGARVNRVYLQHLQDSRLFGLNEMLTQMEEQVFGSNKTGDLSLEISLMTQSKYVDHLIALAKNAEVSNTVRAIARGRLHSISNRHGRPNESWNPADQHAMYLGEKIQSFLELPEELTVQETLKAPDGSPIGMDIMSCDFDY
ncbi:zinc-dependent metalloprotease [Algoriphagus halophytocola]|uniref:Zinc-dependent metalloprotease n=1 Tax=Algoriphagus halophytocola TaxID=2991499 RepID=A0ABY6MJR6_9BACT|nr:MULTISPECIES: zinc-dependent metalloprotease [unclassified Algoriphagus]UZD24021.1 zinc-dependent metalloprotease [Algoriphagus sp. TR-M5]WBL41393.1 zinc-dependent metalloprotease [Algoriphagus sp. TR-M9]